MNMFSRLTSANRSVEYVLDILGNCQIILKKGMESLKNLETEFLYVYNDITSTLQKPQVAQKIQTQRPPFVQFRHDVTGHCPKAY